MTDDPLSLISRISAFSSKSVNKLTPVNAVGIGVTLFVSYLIMNVLEKTDPLAVFISSYFYIIVYYAAVTLCATAYWKHKRQFTTPEVRIPKCNFCGGPMHTTKLRCKKCPSESKAD